MRRVVIASPYSGDVERNLGYLRACLHDCIDRGEAPSAAHGLLTQPGVLDENEPVQRMVGMRAGLAWMEVADVLVVYEDLGVSPGMKLDIAHAEKIGLTIERRRLVCWRA